MSWLDSIKARIASRKPSADLPLPSPPAADSIELAQQQLRTGNALEDDGRLEQALACYQAAILAAPHFARGFLNKGNVLLLQGKLEAASEAYAAAIALDPHSAPAHYNLGNAHLARRRLSAAIDSYQSAVELDESFLQAWIAYGNALVELGDAERAETCYRRALRLKPNDLHTLSNLAWGFFGQKKYPEAAHYFAQILKLDPSYPYALGNLFSSRIYSCDWTEHAQTVAAMHARIATGERVIAPWSFLPAARDATSLLRCTQIYAADKFPKKPVALWDGEIYVQEKIRLAYLSADLHSHATAALMAGLFEAHDRNAFEIIAVSFGPDDRGPMRARLQAAFGTQFREVRELSDRAIAELLRREQVDIAIDLKGYTANSRPGILSHRPAPTQVNYLGYPGSMAVDFIDYLIADRWIIPPEHAAAYSEKIVWLPDSYQVNDAHRRIDARTPTRAELGLPEAAFVFCCFNNSYKITPEIFAVWMRLLGHVPGSVLWLLEDNAVAAANLRAAATREGVDPNRIVFARRAELEQHLARQKQADLFLDTLPCNAHTTASDALWSGVPIVTCLGETLAGRVAASLLAAVGLESLITSDLADYEALALELAQDGSRLRDLRQSLLAGQRDLPLFDTARQRHFLEIAFKTLCANQRAGHQPRSLTLQST